MTLSRLLVEMDDYVPGKGRRRKCESFYDTLWAWPGLCTPSPSLSPGGQDVRWGHDAMSPAVKWYLAPPPPFPPPALFDSSRCDRGSISPCPVMLTARVSVCIILSVGEKNSVMDRWHVTQH